MLNYVGSHRPNKVVLVTECSMSDNVSAQYPEIDFVKPCNLCPHMKRIDLDNILESLQYGKHEVDIDSSIVHNARRSVERMLNGWTPNL